MTKTKLTISEIYSLDVELNGFRNPQNGVALSKGLLNHKLNLLMKYRLTEFADTISAIKKNSEKARMELFKELGRVSDKNPDQYEIPEKVTVNEEGVDVEIDNPNLVKYKEEADKLFESTKMVEHYPFKIESFVLETEENFPIFLSKIVTTEEAPIAPK